MYTIEQTGQFKKSVRRAVKQGHDLEKLFDVVRVLQQSGRLPSRCRDHSLKGGRWAGVRECHIESDWLLAYRVVDAELVLLLIDTGSHSQMLGM
jgi:mRNA interferase YafQ